MLATVLIWLLVLTLAALAVCRWCWCREQGAPPPFRTEDDPTWTSYARGWPTEST